MKKIILTVIAAVGLLTAQAQHNKITAPFINMDLTGVCDSGVNLKWTGTQFKYNGATVFQLGTGGLVQQLRTYDSNAVKAYWLDVYYNGDSKADSLISSVTIGPGQTFRGKTVFAYDASNNVTRESGLLELVPGLYDSSTTIDYYYNGSNQMTESVKRTKQSGSLKFISRYVFTYGANGKVSKEEEYDYNSGWVKNTQTDFTYDASNNMTQALTIGYPGLVNQQRETHTYNASNRRIIQIFEMWDALASAWKYTGKDSTYFIGTNGYGISYNWENNAWQLKDKDTCYTGSTPTGMAGWAQKLDMQINPNPANNSAYIVLSDVQGTTVSVMSLDGQNTKVNLTQTNNAVVIDTWQLPDGIYLVKAVKGSAATVQKLVVLH